MKSRLTITLMLCITVLLTAFPAAAQDTARVRFANLRSGADGLDITDQEGNTLASVGPFGTVTEFMDVSTGVTGLGFSVVSGSGFSTNMRAGFDPIFTAGHDYLALMIGDSQEDADIIIDLTTEFGGTDATVDDGMGRLMVIYFVRDLSSGAMTLWNADNTPMGTTFLSPDTSGFDPAPTVFSVALMPGDYSLSLTAATSADDVLIPQQTLSLAGDEITIIAVTGAYPDAVQALLIGADGTTILGE